MPKAFSYETIKQGEEIILRINAETLPYAPSLEDSPICMSRTIDILMESGPVTKIVFYQKRDFEYDIYETQLLQEIAQIGKDVYDGQAPPCRGV